VNENTSRTLGNGLLIDGLLCFVGGALISALGMAFSLAALFELGWMESSGREGDLRTDGIYKYTRNAQSVGFVTFIVGTILAVNSRKLAVHGLLTRSRLHLLPVRRRTVLREHYGDEYETYCDQMPRFINWNSVTALLRE